MKTKNIRHILANALEKAEKGQLAPQDAKAIIGLANQISTSLATEVKVANLKLRLGHQVDSVGELSVDTRDEKTTD